MKKWFHAHKFLIAAFIIWRLALGVAEWIAPHIIPIRTGYLGIIPWANMDGIHYLTIAREGYFQYGEAFFPMYPIAIRYFHAVTRIPWEWAGELLSLAGFFGGLLLFYDLLKSRSEQLARWAVILLLSFPTAFFFSAIYTEGLFFFFIMATVYTVSRKQFLLASVFGGFASATRLTGILLLFIVLWEYLAAGKKDKHWWDLAGMILIPAGLGFYMWYLLQTTGDPLRFFHVQPAFGANRSGNQFILLPQVIWRYLKIMFTAFGKPTMESYIITLAEFISTIAAYILLYIGVRQKERLSYLWFGLFAITLPTLTGTFSSMPRYILTVFPLFIILGKVRSERLKIALISIFSLLQIIGAMVYLRGWFVA